jgi:pyruvate dehydrogenase (quinone)
MKAAGFLPTGTRLDNPNFADMAKAIGIHGVRVEDPAELTDVLQSAFAHDGPAVIDVVTDPMELVMPPKVTLEQAKGFSLWMMKAVLNGQANELIQLGRMAWAR